MASSLGLDFGTTNTVVALPFGPGGAEPVTFRHRDEAFSAFRSVLCFWQDEESPRTPIETEAGPWAIDRFIENPGESRFLQSLKTFAASPLFEETLICGQRYCFEDLMAVFLDRLRERAGDLMAQLPRRFVVGRPVEFAGNNPDGALATARYRTALASFGIEEIRFVYEPVAAAFSFARRLREEATVLVADFGGGTSDFSIMRFEGVGDAMRPRAVAWSGVGVAGDTFDFQIVDKLVSPRLGKDSDYLEAGKRLTVPRRYFHSFARWSELSIMKTGRDFRDLKLLRRLSLEPKRLQAFIDIVEGDLGYALYKAVSETKARLSSEERTQLHFRAGAVELGAEVDRARFEDWIAEDLARIAVAVDQVLERADMNAGAIDKVFLTGGSSFVPAVRRMFVQRFGAARIETGEELVSIAHGLALIGERDDIDLWCVPEERVAA